MHGLELSMWSRAMVCLFFAACVCATAVRTGASGIPNIAPQEIRRKETADRMDRRGTRSRSSAITDFSHDMLEPPASVAHLKGFSIAREAPVVDFLVLPVEPRYQPQPREPDGPVGLWSSWGQGRYWPATGRFYSAIGNHVYYDAAIHMVDYDPQPKTVKLSPNINTLLGRGPDDFGDGKIHGWVDFCASTSAVMCTYWCKYPEPTPEQFESGYEGGAAFIYDVTSGKLDNLGVPIPRTSYPYHRFDSRRGLLYGVGVRHEFLVYDLNKRQARRVGTLPEGMEWYDRNLIVDEATGCAYSSNVDPSDPDVHMIRYDSKTDSFALMNSKVPPNSMTGKREQIRAHTGRRSKDGWFLAASRNGELFFFYPDEDRIQDLGVCWPGDPKHLYTTSIALSPDDRYAYYIPGAHGSSHYCGTPVIQFDTRTHERKVLAFLFPYYYNKYGYIPSGTFSLDLDERGERLFVLLNGAFNEFSPGGGDVFGDPCVMVVHIPRSERR